MKNFSLFVRPHDKFVFFHDLFEDYNQKVLKLKNPPAVRAFRKGELIVGLEDYFADLLSIEVQASVDKAINTCVDTYGRFMAQAPALIEKANNSINQSGLTKSSSTSKDNHAQCLEARDYEGCMRVKSSGGITAPVADHCSGPMCIVRTKGNDSFGLPKPMGWLYTADDDEMVGSRIMYFTFAYRVPHKGQPNRYAGMKRITRYYQNPEAGTSGTVIGGGTSYTNCVGVGSSLNCSTSGGNARYIPGRSATPGGAQNARFDSVYDCKDNTYASYEGSSLMYGGWEKNPDGFFPGILKKECDKGPTSIMKLDTMKVQM